MDAPFVHCYAGRNLRTALAVAAVYSGLFAAQRKLGVAPVILGLGIAATLPALWDLWSDRRSELRLGADTLGWRSGRARAEIALQEIDHMRFDTRFDFSVRVSAIMRSGRKIRLPHEALPPHRRFENELNARGVRVERHHFTLIG